MALEFKNRRGDIYYLKPKKTKTGKTTYFVTKKHSEDCLDLLPFGYEVFENHEVGTMHVRKNKECKFNKEEIRIVEKELSKNKSLSAFKLDVYGGIIRIYIRENNNVSKESLGGLFSSEELEETLNMYGQFSEMMRIVVDEGNSKKREFEIMRYCFRGSIDDWITVMVDDNLKEVAKTILVHLGKESYYELYGFNY